MCQFTDGRNILNINRDDAAGYRLDTLSTHRLHRSPMVRGRGVLATHTDFVNSYPSVLQTTCYNMTATKTTGEMCAGIVKGAGVFPKNPAQHMADLEMLETMEEMKPSFFNSVTNKPKTIECIRVDGASDEGPAHVEVQFWWTMRHFQKPTLITLVTARNSGASYLNRVEQQNGCLSLAHSNLFIPSNLSGSCFNSETGKVDKEKLKTNMQLATEIYIQRVNNAPCGDTVIRLYPGADSGSNQELREHVLAYVKGSREKKQELLKTDPTTYNFIKEIWDVRSRHLVTGLPPTQYVFFLKCCQQNDCPHPLCHQSNFGEQTWFPGGPPLSYLPVPVPDPAQPWGSKDCTQCQGVCHGHFLSPQEAMDSELPGMTKPPSQLIKD